MEIKNSAQEVRYRELNKVENLWWWSSLQVVVGYLGTWGDIYVLFVFTIFFKEGIVWKVLCERVFIFLNLSLLKLLISTHLNHPKLN
jgi:hypothetical protein